jgi:ribosome-binding ATPase YchF (GTP1/OBG family)
VEDNPMNSACIDGWRYAPVKVIDIPGLIKDAWRGRGLGNRFLSAIGQADALIHVVDASGSIDGEGNIAQPGSGNPVQDIMDVEGEIERWITEILFNNRQQIIREEASLSTEQALARALSGIKAKAPSIVRALGASELEGRDFETWDLDAMIRFSSVLLSLIKPSIIIANKMDLYTAKDNIDQLTEYYSKGLVAACCAEAELVLRRAEGMGLLRYTPGQETFRIVDGARLTPEQERALVYVEERVMKNWMRTGIQQALNTLVLRLLRVNMVYPVADESGLKDNHGNILPDVHLMPDPSTPMDLAADVHTRLAKNYVLAIDARTGIRLPKDYVLRHRDVVKIMTRPT